MHVEIWHNPACSVSRNTLALIRHAGIEPTIFEYLSTAPSRVRLAEAIHAAGLSVREAIREKDALHAGLDLEDAAISDDVLLDAMVANPALIQRPLVMTAMGARMCRPTELVLDILPPCDKPFAKENGDVVIDEHGKRLR